MAAETKPQSAKRTRTKDPYGFDFSLLPPKTAFEVDLEDEKSDSILYSLLLVFFAVAIFLLVLIGELLLVNPQLANSEQAVTLKRQQLIAYSEVRKVNGELFTKVNTLRPVLERNTNATDIFNVSDQIDDNSKLQVVSYNREITGEFVFQVVSRSFVDVETLVEIVEGIETVQDVELRESSFSQDGNVVVSVIAFNLLPS